MTEKVIPESDDTRRVAYASGALTGLRDALDDGIDIRGYDHWNALDKHE
ncbi:family 1 glycosylhydrolase [Paeniglutamicibacter sp. NPDC012692]